MIRRLKDLIAPLSEREFLGNFSSKSRLVVRTTQDKCIASLLPWPTINQVIGAGLIPSSRLHVTLKGKSFPERMYRQGQDGRLVPNALQQLATQGASIL